MINALIKLSKLLTRNQKKKFLLIVFLMIIFSLLEMLSLGMLVPIFSNILNPEGQANMYFLNFTSNLFDGLDQQSILLVLFILFLSLFLFKFIFSFILFYFRNSFTFKIRNNFSRRIFSSYLNKPLDFHIKNNSSKIAINCKYEIDLFTSNILLPILDIVSDFFIFIALFILLLIFDPNITLISISCFGIVIYFYQLILKKRSLIWATERQYFDRLINKVIREGLNSIKEIIFNSKANFFLKKLDHYLFRNLIVSVRGQMTTDMPKHFLELVAIISFLIIFYFMSVSNYQVDEILILMALFAAVSFKMLPTFNRFMSNIQRIRYAYPTIKMIYDELETQKVVEIKKHKFSLDYNHKLKKLIEINDLSFRYPKMNSQVFENASLKLNVGELTGLCGDSGSGKSTFLNLLSGLDNNFTGEIFIDNKNLKKENLTWADQVAYISQQPFFLDDTIKNNIAYAEENVDEKKVIKCIQLSQLENFINELEYGIETLIGEDGTRLSGGQLQRLAIARALYKNFNILILDESLNALDIENETKIINILSDLKKDRIVLLTSHKKSIIDRCDVKYEIINKKFQKLKF